MAYLQNPFNGSRRESYFMNDFSGGINNRTDRLSDKEFADMLNVDLHNSTSIKRRRGLVFAPGFEDVRTPFEGDEDEYSRFLDFYYPYEGDKILVASTMNYHAFYINGTWQKYFGRIYSGLNYKNMYIFALYSGIFAMVKNSTINPGTYVVTEGVRPSNDYTVYKVVTPDSGYTPLDESHTSGVFKYDFVSYSIQYQPCSNELADTYKGANAVPYMMLHLSDLKGRIYCAGGQEDNDIVYISDSGNPFYYPAGTSLQLPPNADRIIGLKAYDDGMIVFRQWDVYIIRGVTNNPTLGLATFELNQLNTIVGLAGWNMFDSSDTYLFYLGADMNVYAITSTSYNEKRLNVQLVSKTVDLKKSPFNLNPDRAYADFSKCVFHDGKFYIVTLGTTIVYDFAHMAWTRYQMHNTFNACKTLDNILIFSCEKQRIGTFSKESDHVASDFGIPFSTYVKTKDLTMNYDMGQKIFKNSYISNELVHNKSVIGLTYRVDDYHDISFTNYKNPGDLFGLSEPNNSTPKYSHRVLSDRLNLNVRGNYITVEIFMGYDTRYVNDITLASPADYNGQLVYAYYQDKCYFGENGAFVERDITEFNESFIINAIEIEYELRGRK